MDKTILVGLVDDKAFNRSSIADKIKEFANLKLSFVLRMGTIA